MRNAKGDLAFRSLDALLETERRAVREYSER
jgi:hypothetical protein